MGFLSLYMSYKLQRLRVKAWEWLNATSFERVLGRVSKRERCYVSAHLLTIYHFNPRTNKSAQTYFFFFFFSIEGMGKIIGIFNKKKRATFD